MKRIAVLGGTGMAGHVAVTYLEKQGYDVYFTSRSAPDAPKSKPINVEDISALGTWLGLVKPDVVLNCIGILQTEADQRQDRAILLNSYLPHYLVRKYAETSTKIIHLSTDCVFSGKRGGYLESDGTDGETVYDRTKALGEIINDKDLTFRMSIIGPDCSENGTGLFNWFMKQQGTIRGFTRAIWNGVTTIELSKAVDSAIRNNLAGLYHLTPKQSIDKYNLLLLFRDTFNRIDIDIKPDDGFIVDKTLINTRKDFNFEVNPYPEQIQNMKIWVRENIAIYPHYNL